MSQPAATRTTVEAAPRGRIASGFRRDLGRFGAATLAATAIGAVQLFIIPRRLDVTTYGAYRLFLVYVGYLGLLHLGIADGAFVRWVGQSPANIRREWQRVVRWLLAWHAAILIVAVAIGTYLLTEPARTYLIAFAAFAAAANLSTLNAYALQAAGDFRGASRVAVIPPAVFVAVVVLFPLRSLASTCGAYIAGYAVAALAGALRARRLDRAPYALRSHDASLAPLGLIRKGLPVLGANLTAGLSQFADRILVSASVSLTSFALYGFASSVMVATTAATQALSRVALSHAGRRGPNERAAFLWRFHDLIALGFGVSLVGVPLFESLVARFLPAYVAALPIVRALTVGAPFWVAMHVVLVGTLQSYGQVRRQLALELTGLVLVLLGAGGALAVGFPLWGVGASATGAAIIMWIIGAHIVRSSVPGERPPEGWRFVWRVGAQCVALLVALQLKQPWYLQSLLYATLALLPTVAAWRAARTWRE